MNRREFLCGGIAMLGVGAAGRAAADAMARHPLAGKSLPKWEKGHFRISMIYTGASESSFLVFPDGTSMLIDARDERGTVLGAYDFTTAKKESLWDSPRRVSSGGGRA